MLKIGANTTKEEVAIKTIKRMIVTISVSISHDLDSVELIIPVGTKE